MKNRDWFMLALGTSVALCIMWMFLIVVFSSWRGEIDSIRRVYREREFELHELKTRVDTLENIQVRIDLIDHTGLRVIHGVHQEPVQ